MRSVGDPFRATELLSKSSSSDIRVAPGHFQRLFEQLNIPSNLLTTKHETRSRNVGARNVGDIRLVEAIKRDVEAFLPTKAQPGSVVTANFADIRVS
jgi:hypothetical protein